MIVVTQRGVDTCHWKNINSRFLDFLRLLNGAASLVNQLMALCDELEVKLRRAQTASERVMETSVKRLLAGLSTASASVAPTHQ